MASKKFHLGDILSITTRRLLSPNGMDGIYGILDFMTNDSLFTHQLIRAADECAPYLMDAMPWLTEIDAEGVNKDNFEEWMAIQVKKYGEFHTVETIPMDDHDIIDPRDELKEMLDGDDSRIIDLDISDFEDPDPPEISPYGDITWKHD